MGRVSKFHEQNPQLSHDSTEQSPESVLITTDKLISEPFCIINLKQRDDEYNRHGKWQVFIRLNDELRHFYINGAYVRNKMFADFAREIKQGNIIHGITLETKIYKDKKTGKETSYPEIADISQPVCPCGVSIEE